MRDSHGRHGGPGFDLERHWHDARYRVNTARSSIEMAQECFWQTRFEQTSELCRRHGTTEIVALCLVTAVSAQKRKLLCRFHALCNDAQLQTAANADHCRYDGSLIGSGADLTHE